MEVNNLVKQFGDFTAVAGISFTVGEGAVFGFLGPNGAGKSTTIRILCGLLLPTSGEAWIAGYDIYKQTEQIRQSIGYMPQSFSLYPDLTVRENIEFYAAMYAVPAARARARIVTLAGQLGLEGLLDRMTRTLSTGWRQRVALATALVHQPPLAFLDEPTSGVDPVTRRHFWEFIDDLAREGTTVFVTTHVMDEAEHCTALVMMHEGDIIARGTPEEMRTRYVRNMVEVHATPLWEALGALQASPLMCEEALFGDALHVCVREQVADPAAAVRETLAAAGITVESAEGIAPTMEDVFVALARGGVTPP